LEDRSTHEFFLEIKVWEFFNFLSRIEFEIDLNFF
jgi:hypothetical protein